MILATFILLGATAVLLWIHTGHDPLYHLIRWLVVARAGLLVGTRAAVTAWRYCRANYTWALADVRRDARLEA